MEDFETRTIEFRAIREDQRQADFVASTETVDTYDSILRQNWDLRRFKKCPTVLFAHKSAELPVGKAVKAEVVDKQLLVTVEFAPAEANPQAEHVWQSVRGGFLRGMSVGFYPHKVSEEEIDGKSILVLDKNELMEVSVTPLPSNPDAIVKLRTRALAASVTKTSPANPPAQTPAEQRGEEARMALEAENAALKTQVAERTGQVTTLEKQLGEERTARATVEKELERTAKERDALAAKLAEVETREVDRLVDGFVGVKIEAGERDEWAELARSNRKLFDKLIEKRAPLPKKDGAEGKSLIGDTKPETRSLEGDGSSLLDTVMRDVRGQN